MNIATLEPWNLVSALHRDVGQLAARNSHTANAGKDSRAFAKLDSGGRYCRRKVPLRAARGRAGPEGGEH